MSAGPRFPLAPLEALLGRPSARELGALTGATRDAVQQWRRRGLSEHQADELAIRAGYHPAVVWPSWAAS